LLYQIQAFRTQTGPSGPDVDAGRFFDSTPTAAVDVSRLSTAFDVSAMRATLPSASVQFPQSQASASLATGWAADFMRVDLDDAQQPKQKTQHIPSPVGPMQARSIDAHVGGVHSAASPLMQSWFLNAIFNNKRSYRRPSIDWNTMGFGMHAFISHTPIQQQAQAPVPNLNDRTLHCSVFEVDVNLTAFIRIILGQGIFCAGSTSRVNDC